VLLFLAAATALTSPNRRRLGPDTSWEMVDVVVDEKADGLEEPRDLGCYASYAQNPVVGVSLVASCRRRENAHQIGGARADAGQQVPVLEHRC
jgi:hypothetical protein